MYTVVVTKYSLILSNIQIVNPHLMKDLTEQGLWNEDMKNQLIAHNGSIQVGFVLDIVIVTLFYLLGVSLMFLWCVLTGNPHNSRRPKGVVQDRMGNFTESGH